MLPIIIYFLKASIKNIQKLLDYGIFIKEEKNPDFLKKKSWLKIKSHDEAGSFFPFIPRSYIA